ncbi:MAG: hypothetical protein AB7Y46_10135 [Armatimonadota bacterium]
MTWLAEACMLLAFLSAAAGALAQEAPPLTEHPRLYFTAAELAHLRALRASGQHARMWQNLAESADWCLAQEPRTEWIAPVAPDPVYLNLYDRFYAMMHDMAVMEHLAFAWAYSGEPRYFEGARRWTLACARVWSREAEGEPDASKAYAVMRLLKGLAVSYDLLCTHLPAAEREEVRDIMAGIAGKYYQWYLDNPGMAGPGQDKHHGSVEASSFGVAALALLGEVPEAGDWLELAVRKHTDYLLPEALTPSGTQEQTSNFWASTMQYRLFFLDALRRVTGRDLFAQFAAQMDGRMALAAVVGRKLPGHNEDNRSILFAPSYGQLDYWSPVLLYLAREYRRPIYQHLALWDQSLGALQRTRYVTEHGEQLLFELGGYAYAWYDSTVAAQVEPDLPLSFAFADVGEAYARAGWEPGGLAVAVRQGVVIIHAGGDAVVVDLTGQPGWTGEAMTLTDSGEAATIACAGSPASQTLELRRPGTAVLTRTGAGRMQWWCHTLPEREGGTLTWPSGVVLRVVQGDIALVEPDGYLDEKVVGMGKLHLADPMPMRYPRITVEPNAEGVVHLQVRCPVGA